MEENIKAFREAQDQSKQHNRETPSQEPPDVDVMQEVQERQKDENRERLVPQKDESISSSVQDSMGDTLEEEELQDGMRAKKATPLKKLISVSQKLGLTFAREAFVEDDPAAFTELLRQTRELVVEDFEEPEIALLESLQAEIGKVHKRAKKSESSSELSAPEIVKFQKVLARVLEVHQTIFESDLPFVLDDIGDVEDGEGNLENLEEMDEEMIDPADQEQLLDDEIFLVEIEEEEGDDYERWSQPILELIAVREGKCIKTMLLENPSDLEVHGACMIPNGNHSREQQAYRGGHQNPDVDTSRTLGRIILVMGNQRKGREGKRFIKGKQCNEIPAKGDANRKTDGHGKAGKKPGLIFFVMTSHISKSIHRSGYPQP